MRNKRFYTGVQIQAWALIVCSSQRQCGLQDLQNFSEKLSQLGNEIGMPINPRPGFCRYLQNQNVDQLEPLFAEVITQMPNIQLIMLVLPGKTPVYGR